LCPPSGYVSPRAWRIVEEGPAWNTAEQRLLGLQGLIVRVSAFCGRGATVPATADVLMIAHGVPVEAVDNLVILMSESVDPGMHEL